MLITGDELVHFLNLIKLKLTCRSSRDGRFFQPQGVTDVVRDAITKDGTSLRGTS